MISFWIPLLYPARRRWWLALAAAALFAARPGPARAGGPFFVTAEGRPMRWAASQPVRYVLAPDPLGPRSNARAAAIVEQAFRTWQEIPTAQITVAAAGQLRERVTGSNVLAFLNRLQPGSASPVLFDNDGSITDALHGHGASEDVLGFSSPLLFDTESGRIAVSYAVFNGRLFSGRSDTYLLATCVHELGHFLNLAHSLVNAQELFDGDPDNEGLAPVMFYRGPNDPGTLHADDRAWFSWLYPTADFAPRTGALQGQVLLPDRITGLRGVHVVARRIGDPQATAVGAVSGFLYRNDRGGASDPARLGEFRIPGLPPGTYTLEIEELDSWPTVPVPPAYLIGGPKFWQEGSSAQQPPEAFTPITVNAGQEITGLKVIVNGESLGEPKEVVKQGPNALPNPQIVTLPAVISGAVEDGRLAIGPPGPDDFQDVYATELSEWMTVTAILSAARPEADLDLYVLRWSGPEWLPAAQRWVIEAASTEPHTPPELLQLRLPPGRYAFGVHRAGFQGSDYLLRLLAAPAPPPAEEPAVASINYLILGDVTLTSAALSWQTTPETPSVVYYNEPQREIGSVAHQREHVMPLTDLAPGTESSVYVYAQGGPRLSQMDQMTVPLATATPPSPAGSPRLVVSSRALLSSVSHDLAEVRLRLSNAGDGDALQVQIGLVTPAPGWQPLTETLSGTALPQPLDVGRIGAGGAGALILRLRRITGIRDPAVNIHGSYADLAGTVYAF